MKSIQDRMREEHSEEKVAAFRAMQKMDYHFKVCHAEETAWRFYEDQEISGRCYVAVGGLDSITLLLFLRSIGIDVPAVSVSVLEDKSIQTIHKALGVRGLKPLKSKVAVIREFGWPVLSKEIAGKISLLQNPSEKNATVRHAIITGETGAYGGWQKNSRMKMSQKWLEKFGGYENEAEGVDYGTPDFKVSDKCCYYLKEKPCDDYARESGRFPYMGLMASEGGRRQKALMLHGCNYISPGTKRSAPFAIFSRQDLLTLTLEMEKWYHEHWEEFRPIVIDKDGAEICGDPIHLRTIVPDIYGEIFCDPLNMTPKEIAEYVHKHGGEMPVGQLRTTKAQRTGCSMCGFGIHMEKRPHRFDQLWERNPTEWEMWMNHVDRLEDGTWYGWGHVLDYIGVEWREPWLAFQEQISLF